MMLTELYYYYANHPAAKVASSSLSPTAGKAACTTAVMPAAELRRDHETALECELSLDRQSRNQLTERLQTKRDGPRLATRTAPNPATRYRLMDRLSEHTFSLSYAHPYRPQPPDAVLGTLVSALRATVARPEPAMQELASATPEQVHRTQAAARRAALSAQRLELIAQVVCAALRVEADQVIKGKRRTQHLAFCRQLAMYLCRQLTGASFPQIGVVFDHHHSSVISACQVIERRMADSNHGLRFRRLVEQLAAQITQTTTAIVRAA
jgi:chromosomal replication initiation ATPase DnaA